MAKKRTKLEVIKDLLEVLKKGKQAKITHLIYKANLSNNSIKPYLEELINNKLMESKEEAGKKYFIITKKGEEFLQEYNKIIILSESYGL
ncbi:hypothetical protein J4233_05155 [Candidatus Pacearchaeota archaeon]|nr:hypothetical protein [Candidatus Pacearchaeota archaeon]